jgi:hypothetical protein
LLCLLAAGKPLERAFEGRREELVIGVENGLFQLILAHGCDLRQKLLVGESFPVDKEGVDEVVQLLLVVEVVGDQLGQGVGELGDQLPTGDFDEEDRDDDVVYLVSGVHRHYLRRDRQRALL